MESESSSTVKHCDCRCGYCESGTGYYSGTWLRSVKRKVNEFDHDGDKFIIPGLVIPSVARVDIENECNALREMVNSQQHTIQDLISDLEEERYASSSSANEAMSMILKLQREKAEIQMEARQFKRFSEEKMAHDQQELMALEELLYRREQSIQSLSCEVQAYKHRMISFGLTESEADGNVVTNLESQFDFASYDYPLLKVNNMNENRDNDNETIDIEKYAFGETPHSLKDIEERINELEESQSQPVPEKIIVGYSPMKKYSSDSVGSFSTHVKEVEPASEFEDETSDRIYTIDSIHNVNNDQKGNIGSYDEYNSFMGSDKESSSHTEIESLEVKKLYARLHALEADRESMRQTLISMRTDKAQLVLLKEIAQQLCKEMPPPHKVYVNKPYNGVGSSFFSMLKWIATFGFLRGKTQRNKHIFIALAGSAGLLMLLDKRPQIGQWRCLSSTSLKK
ncbi:myosin-binding protein 7-like [Bidens hawaiensis]|uniref:myosin-binding protein 7-like n=1 Tax=Bidens hawaiensis TaxID=980011 RepID=UPI00404907CC